MFGLISKKKVIKYLEQIKDGSRAKNMFTGNESEAPDRQRALRAYSQGYEDGTDNVYNALLYRFSLKK
jgi:hypothetical protein